MLRYRYDFLPKGMISRLTVRLHRFVRNPEMAWVTGVLFEREKYCRAGGNTGKWQRDRTASPRAGK